ncbi:MAG: RnfABCDGE type electron transport complex subunit A [Spirochaetales bacterium]|jgi:electron transport complex protein RnfA|nr:RnfABCDGE type electron transport complex subunit A [Spirochaetales bacterium]MBQ2125515.1 RnfABCDGE type electron transport complex subunit A [Spirochaetales bacterium]MBQ2294057.1 RnfABCDGE type electron transport complex subunit A [Spirochaetales bacterium]
MLLQKLGLILISSALINNVVLSQFLGLCPFLGVSKNTKTAAGMGAAVIFVITIASIFTWIIFNYILVPLGLNYLQTIVFIIVIAALVQLVEMILKKTSPTLYKSLGVFLPLITTNCAVLGVALSNIQNGFGLPRSVAYGFCSALGFTIAIVLMAGIREKTENCESIPKVFRGTPCVLLISGLMAIAFTGFAGIV